MRATILLSFLLALFVGLLPLSGKALTPEPTSINMVPRSEYLHDPTGRQSFMDIQQATKHFLPHGDERLDFGLLPGALWVKLDLSVETVPDLDYYLSLSKVHFRKIDFYQFVDGQLVRQVSTGTDLPFATRDVDAVTWAFRLEPNAGEHEILLRLETRSPMQTDIRLTTAETLMNISNHWWLYYGLLVGFFLLLLLLGGCLALVVRHPVTWLGLLFILGALLDVLSNSGLGFALLWPDTPSLNPLLNRFSIALVLGSSGLFAVAFLGIQRVAPMLATTTRISSLALILMMIAPVPSLSPVVAILSFTLVPLLVLTCAVLSYRRKLNGARLIALGFGAYFISVLASILSTVQLLSLPIDYDRLLEFGLLIMVFVMAYGIAQRIGTQRLDAAITTEGLKAKTLFFATISHEIRTPLNGILGMINLLLKENLNEAQERLAGYARTSAESLLMLINDILDYSKIESGKLDLEPIEFDVTQLLEETVESFAYLEAYKHLEIILDTHRIETPTIVADPGRLRQVLNNLISNALKFTESGEVEISARLHGKSGASELSVYVRDTGIGIQTDQLPRLFSMFTQADESTTRKYGGTGLGLSIARQLCELMGGHLSASSKPNIGSVFSFSIQVEIQAQKISIPQPQLEHKNFLLYHPNVAALRVIRAYLEQWGAEVTTTHVRVQFYANLSRERHHVAIFCDELDPIDQPPEVLLTTGMSLPGHAQPIQKPITQSKLARALLGRSNTEVRHATNEPEAENASRLLLVEDNFINTEVAMGILEDCGFRNVEHAENGREAVERLIDEKFDLILMDCQMPELDGYEATRIIRAGEAGNQNEIPIIAMTANAMTGDREKCLAAGMNDYISKPIDPIKLARTLENWL